MLDGATGPITNVAIKRAAVPGDAGGSEHAGAAAGEAATHERWILALCTQQLAFVISQTAEKPADVGEADASTEADVLVEDGSCEFSSWYEEVPTWGWVVGGVAVLGMVMGLRR